jgi:molybdopterin converting factor small subunit
MPTLWVPALMRDLTGGRHVVDVEGETVRQVLEDLDRRYPGFKARLFEGDGLAPSLQIAINGDPVTTGLMERVPPDAELQIVPAMAGGGSAELLEC